MTSRSQHALAAALEALQIEAAALSEVASQISDDLPRAINLLASTKGRIVVSGIGKSGHIGSKIAATLASTGSPSFFIHATEALHGDSGMTKPEDTAILLSNSGKTAEVCHFAELLRRRHIPVVSMTGNPGSPLAKLSTVHLNVAVNREADPLNLAPTTSTTVSLALGDALAAGLMTIKQTTPEEFHTFHPGGSLGATLSGEAGS